MTGSLAVADSSASTNVSSKGIRCFLFTTKKTSVQQQQHQQDQEQPSRRKSSASPRQQQEQQPIRRLSLVKETFNKLQQKKQQQQQQQQQQQKVVQISEASSSTTTRSLISDNEIKCICNKAKSIVTSKTANSKLATRPQNHFVKFSEDEITISKLLGKGGFCAVSEISNITLVQQNNDGVQQKQQQQQQKQQQETVPIIANDPLLFNEQQIISIAQEREFMSQHCLRQSGSNTNEITTSSTTTTSSTSIKSCRYAIKKLHNECYKDKDTLLNGIIDLAIEVQFLSQIKHTSIIKLRAISSSSLPGSDKFFIILDRLYDTLTIRLHKWKQYQQTSINNCWNKILRSKQCTNELQSLFFIERLSYATDIACALKYLHSNNIMYRDIKPDNIGFDIRGDIKLFDFGLAREYDIKNRHSTSGYYYNVTGDTGSPRYMDPRVALGLPYNELCDVYSFCILLWEMLELTVPYNGYSMNLLKRNVYEGKFRPKINPLWSNNIKKILQSGFGGMSKRISMINVCKGLFKEIDSITNTTNDNTHNYNNNNNNSYNDIDASDNNMDALGRSDRSDRSRRNIMMLLKKQESLYNI